MSEAGYIVSENELLFLISMAGAQRFLGVSYPRALDTLEKVEDLWQEIHSSLELKNYVFDDSDGRKTVDARLMELITVCAKPAYFITCRTMDGDLETVCFYYIASQEIVRLEKDTNMPGHYILTPIKSPARFVINIDDIMGFSDTHLFSEGDAALTLQPDDLSFIMENDMAALQEMPCVKASALPSAEWEDLVYALQGRNQMRTMLALRNTEADTMLGYLFAYGGRKYLWKMEKNEGALDFSVTTPKEMSARLQGIVSQLGMSEIQEDVFL